MTLTIKEPGILGEPAFHRLALALLAAKPVTADRARTLIEAAQFGAVAESGVIAIVDRRDGRTVATVTAQQ